MISAVVLAAGMSNRLGRPKLLEKLGDQTMIEHVVDNVIKSTVKETIVVLGANREAVLQALSHRQVITVYNSRFEEGQGTSVAAGVAAISPGTEGVMFLMGDQPLVSAELINRLIKEFNSSGALIMRHAGSGTPVIFSTKLQDELAKLSGDVGGRQLFSKYFKSTETVRLGGPETMDIDTEEDLQAARRLWNKTQGRRISNVRKEDSPKKNG